MKAATKYLIFRMARRLGMAGSIAPPAIIAAALIIVLALDALMAMIGAAA